MVYYIYSLIFTHTRTHARKCAHKSQKPLCVCIYDIVRFIDIPVIYLVPRTMWHLSMCSGRVGQASVRSEIACRLRLASGAAACCVCRHHNKFKLLRKPHHHQTSKKKQKGSQSAKKQEGPAKLCVKVQRPHVFFLLFNTISSSFLQFHSTHTPLPPLPPQPRANSDALAKFGTT